MDSMYILTMPQSFECLRATFFSLYHS